MYLDGSYVVPFGGGNRMTRADCFNLMLVRVGRLGIYHCPQAQSIVLYLNSKDFCSPRQRYLL